MTAGPRVRWIALRAAPSRETDRLQNNRVLLRLVTVVHRALYRASGGLLGANLGAPMLLLTTTGRKTRKQRTTPLLYVRDGERFVIVASNAGDDRPPAWWLNLEAEPRARVQVGGTFHAVHARRAGGDERDWLWRKLVAAHAEYEEYTKRTRREIPVIVLEPI
jgi:deazaflavin-dependent oxidoreductase (nitroreductase family)